MADENKPILSEAKHATKIRIIEDAEAAGETAAAYDVWRAKSGRTQMPGILKCFGQSRTSCYR